MINKSEQTLENRLVKDIDELKRGQRDIKNVQLIGADNTVIQGTNVAQGVAVVPAGTTTYFIVTVTPTDQILTLWNMFFTIYIDGVGFDDDQIFPSGSNLTADQLKHRVYTWPDWAISDDDAGMRRYRVLIENYDASQHTVGIQAKLYSIKNPSAV